jgi:hypothetical protein
VNSDGGDGGGPFMYYSYGGTMTNCVFSANVWPIAASVQNDPVGSGPFPLVSTNNIYYTYTGGTTANTTNNLDYANGSRYYINGTYTGATTKYRLLTSDASQIPNGAQMYIYNGNSSSAPVTFILNAGNNSQATVSEGLALGVTWGSGQWNLTVVTNSITPPNDFYIISK